MNKPFDFSLLIDSDLNISAINLMQDCIRPANWKLEQKSARPEYALVFIQAGAAVFSFPQESFAVQKNSLVFLPKGASYRTDATGDDNYHFTVLSFQLKNADVLARLALPYVTRPKSPHLYQHSFRLAAQLWQRKDILYKLKCQSILSEILHQFLFETASNIFDSRLAEKLSSAFEIMNRYYTEQLSIGDLAASCKLSQSHFRRLFNQAYGLSPMQYLMNLRINKAKDLIHSDLYSITELAERSGFANIYYFSRVFREFTGFSPTEYRNLK